VDGGGRFDCLDLDVVISGFTGNASITNIYRNVGGFVDIHAGLRKLMYASVAWGDCDNDGDQELLLMGLTDDSNPATFTEV
jgi:hypothetical protein